MNTKEMEPLYNSWVIIYEGNCKKGYTHTWKEADNICKKKPEYTWDYPPKKNKNLLYSRLNYFYFSN